MLWPTILEVSLAAGLGVVIMYAGNYLKQKYWDTGMKDFIIHVRTGDRQWADTDANIKMILRGKGSATEPLELNRGFKHYFERGHDDSFIVDISACDIPIIETVEFWRDRAWFFGGWYVDKIVIENLRTNRFSVFPVYRWIEADNHYVIHLLDTDLPQFDDRKTQRAMELSHKQKNYVLEQKAPGIPVQAKDLPSDEEFRVYDKVRIVTMQVGFQISAFITNIFTWKPKSIRDLDKLYNTKQFPMPLGAYVWRSDAHFGAQRLTGVNINIIKRCTEIPAKLGVDDAMLRPFLEGLSLEEALKTAKVYMTDLEILAGITPKTGVIPAPIALFFVNSKKELMPIAIQLFQEKGLKNPVFLPSDDEYLWLTARTWYNMADGTYHQALAHITFTHFAMEGFSLATQRQLSISHPIHKLLAPHFFDLIAINALALEQLINEGGFIDKHHNYGRETVFELARKAKWRLDVDGTLPESLKTRGVEDPDKLPGYYYRDDALLFFHAMRNYVTKYVNYYYDTPEKMTGDWELQAWAVELTKSKDDGGVGILGIPGDGKFTNAEQLITTLTSVIFQCSVGHAGVNFPQYDEYGYQLRYTSRCSGDPPRDKKPRTEQDLLDLIPDNYSTLQIMGMVKLLSTKKTANLGLFEVPYIHDPVAIQFVNEFRCDIQEIKNVIDKRNEGMSIPYTTLNPIFVPNAISI